MTEQQRRLLEAIDKDPGRVYNVTLSGSIQFGRSSAGGYHVPEADWRDAEAQGWCVLRKWMIGGMVDRLVAGMTEKGRKALDEN